MKQISVRFGFICFLHHVSSDSVFHNPSVSKKRKAIKCPIQVILYFFICRSLHAQHKITLAVQNHDPLFLYRHFSHVLYNSWMRMHMYRIGQRCYVLKIVVSILGTHVVFVTLDVTVLCSSVFEIGCVTDLKQGVNKSTSDAQFFFFFSSTSRAKIRKSDKSSVGFVHFVRHWSGVISAL